MSDLKYTVIKNEEQYDEYCKKLEILVKDGLDSQAVMDEYELLQLLIARWDEEHQLASELNPVELVKSLKDEHGLNQTELARIAGVGKSYISEILNYKKRMSKRVIRNLANHFKIQQEALNKHYHLEGDKRNHKDQNTSKVFSIETGNQVKYDEQSEELIRVPLQGELAVCK